MELVKYRRFLIVPDESVDFDLLNSRGINVSDQRAVALELLKLNLHPVYSLTYEEGFDSENLPPVEVGALGGFKQLRLDYGLNQRQVAKALGLSSKTSISRYEKTDHEKQPNQATWELFLLLIDKHPYAFLSDDTHDQSLIDQ